MQLDAVRQLRSDKCHLNLHTLILACIQLTAALASQ